MVEYAIRLSLVLFLRTTIMERSAETYELEPKYPDILETLLICTLCASTSISYILIGFLTLMHFLIVDVDEQEPFLTSMFHDTIVSIKKFFRRIFRR